MKKFLAVPLALCALGLGLTACGGTAVKTPAKPTAAQVTAQANAKKAAAEAKAAAAQAKAKAALAKVEQQVQQDEAVSTLKSMILKDARSRAAEGFFDGPIKSVSCDPATTADSSGTEATFDCLAINKTDPDGTQSGYGYVGAANYATGEVTAHVGNS